MTLAVPTPCPGDIVDWVHIVYRFPTPERPEGELEDGTISAVVTSVLHSDRGPLCSLRGIPEGFTVLERPAFLADYSDSTLDDGTPAPYLVIDGWLWPHTDEILERAARLVEVASEIDEIEHAADIEEDMAVECPYFARYYGFAGHDPNATCRGGCYSEPECVTSEPIDGWPSARLPRALEAVDRLTEDLARSRAANAGSQLAIDEILGVCEGSPNGGVLIINDIADLARRAKTR